MPGYIELYEDHCNFLIPSMKRDTNATFGVYYPIFSGKTWAGTNTKSCPPNASSP